MYIFNQYPDENQVNGSGGLATAPPETSLGVIPQYFPTTTTTSNMKENLLKWIIAKPLQAAAIIALLFASLGFFIAKKVAGRKR